MLTILAMENPVALSRPMESTGLVGIVSHEKCQTQTLLSCTWGATDPGVQALVDSVGSCGSLVGRA